MTKRSTVARHVLVCGLVGIIGALITIVSDLILLGKPHDAYSFLILGTQTMADIPASIITAGTFLGVFALPFEIAGLITVYYGLKQAGKWLSLVVVIPLVHALIMSVAFHVSYAFIGSAWKLNYEMGLQNASVLDMINKFDYYWKLIISVIASELLFSSILFAIMIFKRNTLYPFWMAFLNPFFVIVLIFPFIFSLATPIGGFIAPTFLNLAVVIFFTLSTIIIYKKTE